MAKTNSNRTVATPASGNRPRETGGSTVAWTALVIALGALALSALAYNRTGVDIEDVISRNVGETADEIRLEVEKVKAGARLAAIRQRQETTRNYAELEVQVNEVRTELETAFKNAGQESSEAWRQLNQDFTTTANQIRASSADALLSLGIIIEKLGNIKN